MSTYKAILEKLKKILKVSVKIKMDQMRDILKMDQTTFNDKIMAKYSIFIMLLIIPHGIASCRGG